MAGLTPISYRMHLFGPDGSQTILFCDEPKPWTLEEARNSAKAQTANTPSIDRVHLHDPSGKQIAAFVRHPTGGISEEDVG